MNFNRIHTIALIAATQLAFFQSGSASHISVWREQLLESGQATITPTAIVKTPDDGYIITGQDMDQPWALKVDGKGTVIWHHRFGEREKLGHLSQYSGAVPLQDGSVVLCGTVDLEPPTTHKPAQIYGLITRLDRRGTVVSQTKLQAGEEDAPDRMSQFDQCVKTETGILAAGYTINGPGLNPPYFYWLIGVDGRGSVQWQRTIPVKPSEPELAASTTGIRTLVPTMGGDFVFITRQDLALRISAVGSPKNEGRMEILVQSISNPNNERFPLRSMPEVGTARITSYDESLDGAGTTLRSHSDGLVRSAIYELGDHGLAVFGSVTNSIGTPSAAVGWISPSGDEAETLVLQPPPTYSSVKVAAAVPTGQPGEFATVRRKLPMSSTHNSEVLESTTGVILSFVRFQ
jgi:hypothetical protein